MYRTYVLATEPIRGADVTTSVWPTSWSGTLSARITMPAGHRPRLLLGGEDRLVRAGQRPRQQPKAALRDLRVYFEARLPAVATVRTGLPGTVSSR